MSTQTPKTGKICVSVSGSSITEALNIAQESAAGADVLEIRLDLLPSQDIVTFVNTLHTPLLFTNRAKWEGGNFSGGENERIGCLHQAIEANAAFIDIELKAEQSLRQEIISNAKNNQNTTSIVSWHNFDGTPSDQALLSILQEQYRSGADVGKIITLAQNPLDVLRVLDLQKTAAELDFPLIAFCMGRAGAISRFATLELGGFMKYASPDNAAGTAPGQLPLSTLLKMKQEFSNGV